MWVGEPLRPNKSSSEIFSVTTSIAACSRSHRPPEGEQVEKGLAFCTKLICGRDREKHTQKSARVFQIDVLSWTSARDVRVKMLVFLAGFGGPDRSFWPDVRTDLQNFLFGLIFRSRFSKITGDQRDRVCCFYPYR